MRTLSYNHTHTGMQWFCTMVKAPGPGTSTGICTGTLQKLTRYLHRNLPERNRYVQRNPPEPNKVSALEPSGASPGISTNMNWYKRNHVGRHAVTNCIWSCVRHHDMMPTLSYNHAHTIIQIQSYTYKHTHATMQWCCTQVCDAFPWKVVQTHNVQVFALHTFVFIIRCCCWQNCLWIWGKIVFESAASNQHELIHTQSLWITQCYKLYMVFWSSW